MMLLIIMIEDATDLLMSHVGIIIV